MFNNENISILTSNKDTFKTYSVNSKYLFSSNLVNVFSLVSLLTFLLLKCDMYKFIIFFCKQGERSKDNNLNISST